MNTHLRLAAVSLLLGALAVPIACGSSESSSSTSADSSASPPCNAEDPATLAHYDAAGNCLEPAAPVPGTCLSSLHLSGSSVGGLACAFDEKGNAYVRAGVEGDWLTGVGWHFSNLVPTGPFPEDEQATETEIGLCSSLACLNDCSTGQKAMLGAQCPGAALDASADAADAGHVVQK